MDQPRRSYGVGVSDDLGGFVGLGVLVGWRVGVGLGVLVGLMVGVGAVVGSAVGPGSVAMSVGVAWICVGMIEVFDGITKGVPVKITRRVAVGVLVGVEVRVGWPSGGIVDVGRVEVGDGVKVYIGVGEPVEVGDIVRLAVSVREGVKVMVSVGEGVRVLKSVENAWIVSALSVLAVAVERPPVSGNNRLGSMRSECEER